MNGWLNTPWVQADGHALKPPVICFNCPVRAPFPRELDVNYEDQKMSSLRMAEVDVSCGSFAGFRKNCEEGRLSEALHTVKLMEKQGIHISTKILFFLLKGCMNKKDLSAGREVNLFIRRSGFEANTFLGSHLIRMFTLCGSLVEANVVFSKLAKPNVFAWNAIISAHTKLGQAEHAIELYHNLRQSSVNPNEHIFVAVLKACGNTAALTQGKLIHSHVIQSCLESDLFVGNTLMNMYAKCGFIGDAQRVFDKLTKRDVVSWNAMIIGNAQDEHGEEALQLFYQMQQEGTDPDDVTFTIVLKVCSSMATLDEGKLIHKHIVKNSCDLVIFVGNALVDMYVTCGSQKDAGKVFEKLPKRDVVTWSTMISGYAQHGYGQEALDFFHQMLQDGIQPNIVTYFGILKACTSLSGLDQGKQMHANFLKNDFELDDYIGSSLIDMYAKCGSLEDAQRVFKNFPRPNMVTWNSMIAAYAQHGHGQDALQIFQQLQQVDIEPDRVTFLSALKACSTLAALDWGKLIHAQIVGGGFTADMSVDNTLIDMYSKCGSLADACRVFGIMPTRGVVAWSAMIAGYALHSDYEEALQHFKEMQQEGLKPNDVTFVSLISACGHKGLVDKGYSHFHSMRESYGITPTPAHFNCMVDLLGRAGRVEEAADLLLSMPIHCKLLGWTSLLNHCKTHKSVELGRTCFDHIVTTDCREASAYSVISEIYINANILDEAHKIKEIRNHASLWKKPGKAFIQVDNMMHDFIVGDASHPRSEKIHEKLKTLAMQMKIEDRILHPATLLESI